MSIAKELKTRQENSETNKCKIEMKMDSNLL